jgi:DNA-directed RNA polymerase specialized sigma24 family protein
VRSEKKLTGVQQNPSSRRLIAVQRADIVRLEETAAYLETDVSLSELYREQRDSLIRLAFLMTGSRYTAADVVQDCFVGLSSRIGRVENPSAYLRASVANACRSLLRKQRRESLATWRLGTAGYPISPSARELLDAVSALPPSQRVAIVLRYYEDWTTAEIASAMGCRASTARSHLRRGLIALRRVVDE